MIHDEKSFTHEVNAISVRWCCTRCSGSTEKVELVKEFSKCGICRPNREKMLVVEYAGGSFKRSRYWYSEMIT